MKKLFFLAALAGCLFSFHPSYAQQVTPDAVGYIVKVGDEAPDFEMTLTDGEEDQTLRPQGKGCHAAIYRKLVWSLP